MKRTYIAGEKKRQSKHAREYQGKRGGRQKEEKELPWIRETSSRSRKEKKTSKWHTETTNGGKTIHGGELIEAFKIRG